MTVARALTPLLVMWAMPVPAPCNITLPTFSVSIPMAEPLSPHANLGVLCSMAPFYTSAPSMLLGWYACQGTGVLTSNTAITYFRSWSETHAFLGEQVPLYMQT